MNFSTFSFNAVSTSTDLRLLVRFDGEEIFNQQLVATPTAIDFKFDDNIESEHVLEIELADKTSSHTIINDEGDILTDNSISITDFTLDGIELDYAFYSNTEYNHNFNSPVLTNQVHDFFGTMGCNGVVTFKFNSPTYIWLLEKM